MRGVFVGFLASVLVALGSTSHEHSFAGRWAWQPMNMVPDALPVWVLRGMLGVGVMTLVAAWWMVRPVDGRASLQSRWWIVLCLWCMPFVIVPPVLTADAFAYADAGWILEQGSSPYEAGLGGHGGPYLEAVDPQWVGVGTAWPPLSLYSAWVGAATFGFDPYWGVIGQRVMAMLGVLLIAVCLPRVADITGSPRSVAVWLGCLNPVVLIHFVGGAHVDGLAVGLTVFAWWFTGRVPGWRGFLAGAIIVGLAMSLKQYAGLGVVGVAGVAIVDRLSVLPWFGRTLLIGLRSALAAVMAIGTFIGVAALTGLGFGWSGQMGAWYGVIGTEYPAGHLLTLVPSFVVGDLTTLVAAAVGVETLWFYQVSVVVCVVLGALGLCILFVRYAHNPWAFMGWAGFVTVLSAQQLHPWYLGFGLVALSCGNPSERGTRIVVFCLGGYILAYLTVGLPRLALVLFLASAGLMWACHKVYGKDDYFTTSLRVGGER